MLTKNATGLPLFAIGFISIGFQIYLLREFLIVFNGQEMVISIAISGWILLTGIGSFLGRLGLSLVRKTRVFKLALILIGIMPMILIILLYQLKFFLTPPGSFPDFLILLLIIIVIQFPFCLVNGFLFTMLSGMIRDISISRCYAWESLGSVFAGILINFLFLWIFTSAMSVWLLSLFYYLILSIYVFLKVEKKIVPIFLLLSVVVFLTCAHFQFAGLTGMKNYPGQRLIAQEETPLGQVVITQSPGQLNFYENGLLLFSSGNEIAIEEGVHYTMVQHPDPRNILLISGGFSGMITEIMKYKPDRIDYVELDPSLIMIASKFTRQVRHKNVNVYSQDARNFLKTAKQKYDVVIVNLPPPATFQINRFYTREFCDILKMRLKPGAYVSWCLPATGDYQTENEEKLGLILWHTLKKTFPQVHVIPGNRNYFIASDSSISLDIPKLIIERNIQTLYVNQYYLNYQRILERAAEIYPGDKPPPTISRIASLSDWENHDFYPAAVFVQTAIWFQLMKLDYGIVMLFFFILLSLMILTLKPINAGLFTGGFTLASAEIILIFSLQVLFGNIFLLIGITITLIMAGLTIGSYMSFGQRFLNKRIFIGLQVIMAMFAGLLAFSIYLLDSNQVNEFFSYLIILILSISGSFIAGLEYQSASLLSLENKLSTVSKNYSADMFGASLGILTVTFFIIPMIGVYYTCLLLVCLNLISASYSKIRISL